MRKLFLASLVALLLALATKSVAAGEYLAYQEIAFEHDGPRLLDDYTDRMYEKYYKKVKKRRFWGWRVHTAYETETVYFIKETLYVIKNEGETPITETFRFETSDTVKKQYNVSGSIGLTAAGTVKGFKLNLEQELDHSITATTTNVYEEEFNIKVLVDPGTILTVQIKGEGNLSNGVANYFIFWKSVHKGGWEVFTVTTEYYSLEKLRIDGA